MPMRVIAVAGARPNFMKVAPLLWEIQGRDDIDAFLVHTGQHYDERMSQLFFDELRIPKPDANLEVGSGSHAVQTAEVMRRFEPIVESQRPDAVVVVGDVNSTLACALVAAKLGVPVAHVEAGLRSGDESMPEEINRRLTDALSRWLFVSEPSGLVNLRKENVPEERLFYVGNVMIDTLHACRERCQSSPILETLSVETKKYAVLTLHRPANVDEPEVFERMLAAIARLQREIPIVFPVHPRTRRALVEALPRGLPRLILTEPLGYLDFLKLVSHARLVLTDSGGVQEETTVLGVPCLTLRDNTERPVTVTHGTNCLVGRDPDRILSAALSALGSPSIGARQPDKWDGEAAQRIIDVLTAGRIAKPSNRKTMGAKERLSA
ncbi:MAG: UDP-N-acetylglucosamine 2-epimerase (non-hydrolyzing) [Gemmataceae bacterium]|nr:UDP-N-acetylglucosamine 2-epimerase (non-hydrolyzing) [Gemmataceae bacterium]MCI0739339.1 UDP-N-acetylglucosamine 2-epimerase (non-hydrolyzing) [Gemmataceae bacterium]